MSGDFGDAKTYTALAQAISGTRMPMFYLEIPPSLFGMVIGKLTEAGLDENRPGHRGETVRPRRRLGPGAGRRAAPVHR